MCGRFTLSTPPDVLAQHFQVAELPGLSPRYNIAPTQDVPIVRVEAEDGGRAMVRMRWGLVPFWADDPSIGNRMINARAETASEKPAFRAAFKRRRCLVPADGFYEWQRQNGTKQPYHIRLDDGGPFGMAGLYERWTSDDAPDVLETFTILTTDASDFLAPIHGRMPVILHPNDYEAWLDPGTESGGQLEDLLVPYTDDDLRAVPVSTRVNSPQNDAPEVLEPVGPEEAPA